MRHGKLVILMIVMTYYMLHVFRRTTGNSPTIYITTHIPNHEAHFPGQRARLPCEGGINQLRPLAKLAKLDYGHGQTRKNLITVLLDASGPEYGPVACCQSLPH
jgi:hypothetical protein